MGPKAGGQKHPLLILWVAERETVVVGRVGPVRVLRLKPGPADGDLHVLMHGLAPTSRTAPPRLVLSVGEATVRSDALGVLIAAHEQHRTAGGEMVLCNVNPRVQEVLSICRLDELLCVVEDEQTAIEHLLYDLPAPTAAQRP